MKTYLKLMIFCAASLSQAQLLFHENFDLEPQGPRGILGGQNGWKEAWNRDGDSQAILVDMNLSWEAPFASRGRALQIRNSREGAFRELPESLNGKTVYFSYLFRYFQEEGGTGQLRVRSDAGHIIAAGFADDRFLAQVQSERTAWGRVRDRENYFVTGRLEISEDGQSVKLSVSTFTTRAAIPLEAPENWDAEVTQQGLARNWNGVEFLAASQNVAFDDLRIGQTWRDVAGTRR